MQTAANMTDCHIPLTYPKKQLLFPGVGEDMRSYQTVLT